jgi:DUF971 family protein
MRNADLTDLEVSRRDRTLTLIYADGTRHVVPAEYLRVFSPSAEVRGHGPGQETLVTGKEAVGIEAVEPVGNYAVRIRFDDGHDTGLYSLDYLEELAIHLPQRWADYLAALAARGIARQGPPP